MATETTTKIENPKHTPAQLQLSDSIPNPSPLSEDVHSITSNPSKTPPSAGGGETTAAASSDHPDAAGVVTDVQKKMRRAERFGMPLQLSEEEKRSSRAERFGSGTGWQGSEALKGSEENKRKARAERFGLVQSSSADEEAKKRARLNRFAQPSMPDSVEEDKRKARAIRFSESQPTSLKQLNGVGKIKTKAAVLSMASGGP